MSTSSASTAAASAAKHEWFAQPSPSSSASTPSPASASAAGALDDRMRRIRNFCVLAHVDHGKTTLCDALIASNGVISQKMVGFRYLDSLPEEQDRLITMKANAISLTFKQDDKTHLLNLIDSPGHVDFSSEVSTAVRLSDGAVVLVDVVEGVCPQTHAVLRQAWLEGIKPVLVLNKMDRLILELQMTPLEAHRQLQRILEQVNAITASLFTAELMKKAAEQAELRKLHQQEQADESPEARVFDWSLEEQDDTALYFSPDQGNVVFASVYDGWGFGVEHFAQLYARKLGIKPDILRQTLWGDYYLNTKTKRIHANALAQDRKPMFVQFVLDNIWAVYDAVMNPNRDQAKLDKIISTLGLTLNQRDMKSKQPRVQLQAVCGAWLPVAPAVMSMICQCLPSPVTLAPERVRHLLYAGQPAASFGDASRALEPFVASPAQPPAENATTTPTIAFISKMVAFDRRALPLAFGGQRRPGAVTQPAVVPAVAEHEVERRREIARQMREQKSANATPSPASPAAGAHQELDAIPLPLVGATVGPAPDVGPAPVPLSAEVFVAYARVFSGALYCGQTINVLSPKYQPIPGGEAANSESLPPYASTATIQQLFVIMGRELEPVTYAPAGTLVGILGLEGHVLKSATLSSTLSCPSFGAMHMEAAPIVRVALEPQNLSQLAQLKEGLRLLNQADPCVEVLVQETGEHVIVTAGEVHLERCLNDLRDRYAKIPINVSKPIVPFRETVVPPPQHDEVGELIANQAVKELQPQQSQQQPYQVDTSANVPFAGFRSTQNDTRNASVPTSGTQSARRSAATSGHASDDEDEDATDDKSGGKRQLSETEVAIDDVLTDLVQHQATQQQSQTKSSRMLRLPDNCVEVETANKLCRLRVRAVPLPPAVVAVLEQYAPVLRLLMNVASPNASSSSSAILGDGGIADSLESMSKLKEDLAKAFESVARDPEHRAQGWSAATVESIWSLGPRRVGPNILFNRVPGLSAPAFKSLWTRVADKLQALRNPESAQQQQQQQQRSANGGSAITSAADLNDEQRTLLTQRTSEVDNSIVQGFQLATLAGPLCEEPMVGVAFAVEAISFSATPTSAVPAAADGAMMDESATEPTAVASRSNASLSGMVLSAVKEALRQAVLAQPARLMMAMYQCDVQVTTESLGKLYPVISRRNGRILAEDMKEGTSLFLIKALLPVVESFGFSEEMRIKTSGAASPLLVFSHWEVLPQDPYWVPTTEEEKLHYGDKADAENVARRYMNAVRRRKGLRIDEKVVEHAEKQRTISRNK
ncbi:elongation factor Tu GTP binding domain containing 1 [Capsaspora owczarzaki ATCC 30864]|nr:elongation factor Tu GTP binding domain containing 1 [Capsaspora owczarzaki ATCC 30864]|eukprot:XP_004343730.2 elongation factor Tu GTP binding domain containing 1 [Capsaspora owczarzaki ATCC 30864]